MASIQIPEPCHENWADFTPTQKGAFCGSCQIDVVDFSNKSPEQVKKILKENAGKHMCGRFRKSQLDELNNDFHLWENQSTKTFQSKFIYACLIVFGLTLFTSCNVSEENFISELGFAQVDENTAELNMVKPAAELEVEKDTTKKPVYHKLGKIKYVPEENEEIKSCDTPPDSLQNTVNETIKETQEFIKGDVANPYDEELLGNVIVALEPVDTVKEEPIVIDSLYNDEMIDGEIAWSPEFENFVEDTLTENTESECGSELPDEMEIRHVKGEIVIPVDESEIEVPSDTVQTENTVTHSPEGSLEPTYIAITPAFESKLYPNPTRDKATVVINVNEESMFSVYLYAINGKMVRDIFNGILQSGRQEIVIDLSAYEAGSYLIVINSETQKESLKLEKLD